jgi:hypothetical protein
MEENVITHINLKTMVAITTETNRNNSISLHAEKATAKSRDGKFGFI